MPTSGTVEEILGGLAPQQVRLPRSSLDSVSAIFGSEAIGHLTHGDTADARLSVEVSAELLRLAAVLAHATDVFGDYASARRWLYAEVESLAARPVELLREGRHSEVDATLGRIEHGVYG
jgi:putative toxin-antitoxin system antitoxin component (TIGR02293 family)